MQNRMRPEIIDRYEHEHERLLQNSEGESRAERCVRCSRKKRLPAGKLSSGGRWEEGAQTQTQISLMVLGY